MVLKSKYDCSPGNFIDMLGEEATEVAKEVFKVHRFGQYAEGKAPGYMGKSAREMLHQEIGDFLAILLHMVAEKQLDAHLINEAILKKRQRVLELFGVELEPNEQLLKGLS